MKSRNGPILLRGFSFALIATFASGFAIADDRAPGTLRVWVFSDAHVDTDQRNGRESLATALRQSESAAGFDWDIALDLGDFSGAQGTPQDAEGAEIVRQFAALSRHRREQIYDLSGNHDRSGLDEPQAWWWRKWIDPTGEHTSTSGVDASRRPFPIEGTWERYSFRVGNLLFLMMSDINEPSQKVGRGTFGGNPGGVVSGETFRWWQRMVEKNPASIIVSTHHYVLKNTTVASGEWEGMRREPSGEWKPRYHGYFPQGTPQGASFLYWVGSKQDSHAFEDVLGATPGRVSLWLGAHTHTVPDDTYGGKSHVERRWGTTFVNVAGLTKYHGPPENEVPRSWLLTFTEGSDEVRAQCYLHSDDYAPQGWYDKVASTIKLSAPFRMPAGKPMAHTQDAATLGRIDRLDPAFDRLIDPGTVIELLAAKQFEWAEGPVWDAAGKRVLFSDVPRNMIWQWSQAAGLKEFLKPSGYTGEAPFTGREPGSNGLAFNKAGELVMCQHGDRRVAKWVDGKFVTLADRYGGKRLNSPNDLAIRSNGDVYFTDPPYGLPKLVEDPGRELDFQGVYRIGAKGELTLLTKELNRPNGLAFSPDEKTLYVANSEPERAVLMAYPVKPDGSLGEGKVFFDVTAAVSKQKPGLPDGLKVSADGTIWASGPGGVLVYSPQGKHLGTLATGVATANLAFGDDGSTLYITADKNLARVRTKVKGAVVGRGGN